MRIAHYCPLDFSSLSGMHQYVLCLSREAVKAGHEALIVTDHPSTEEDAAWLGTAEFRAGNFDVVHSHGIFGKRNRLYRSEGAGVVHTLHGSSIGKRLAVRSLRGFFNVWHYYAIWSEMVSARRADLVIAVGDHTANEAIRYYHVPPTRVRSVPPGFELAVKNPSVIAGLHQELGLMPGGKVALFVGRHDDSAKGVGLLLSAFDRLCRSYPNLRLLMVPGGGAPVRPWLIPVRRVDRTELAQLYYLADFLISSSLYEGLSVVLLEAMAAGCPVVATAIGGTTDAVRDGETGVLVPTTVDGLVQGVQCLLDNKDYRRELGQNGAAHAAEYQWSAVAPRILQIYEEVCTF